MSRLMSRFALPLAVVLFGIFAMTASAGNVDLTGVLANPSFEGGNGPGGCPTNWTCISGNGPTSYTVTANQYTAGSDGLASGIVPGGTHAGTCPYPWEGACAFGQFNLGTYQAGNTYTLTFWVGTPKTLPYNGTTPVGTVQTFRVYFVGVVNGGFNQMSATDIVAPAPGQWKQYTITFTPTGLAVGQGIGVEFFVNGGANNLVADIDFAAPACSCP